MWLNAPYSQLEYQSHRNQWVWPDWTAKGQTALHWYHGKEANLWLGTSPWWAYWQLHICRLLLGLPALQQTSLPVVKRRNIRASPTRIFFSQSQLNPTKTQTSLRSAIRKRATTIDRCGLQTFPINSQRRCLRDVLRQCSTVGKRRPEKLDCPRWDSKGPVHYPYSPRPSVTPSAGVSPLLLSYICDTGTVFVLPGRHLSRLSSLIPCTALQLETRHP